MPGRHRQHARRTMRHGTHVPPTLLSYVALLLSLIFAGWAVYHTQRPLPTGSTSEAAAARPANTPPAPLTLTGPLVNAPIRVENHPPNVAVTVDPPNPTPAVTAARPAPTITVRPRVLVDPPRTYGTSPTPPGSCLPPYPGAVYPGQRGSRVLAWQRVLIAAGLIHGDRPGNLDGWYGPGLTALVDRLQAAWGWSPVPGYAGPRTYRQLTAVTCR